MINQEQLNSLDKEIDELLAKETSETLRAWIISKRDKNPSNTCKHDWDEGNHGIHKCKICGNFNC